MKRCYLFFMLFLAGCKVGPNYHKPETVMPDAFSESQAESTLADQDFYKWWEHWNDPLLNSLVQQAVESNLDFLIAIEKIIESRSYYRIESSYLGPEIDLTAMATRSRFSQNIFNTRTDVEAIADDSNASSPRGAGFGPAVQNFFQIGFDAVWEMDVWGRLRRNQQAAFEEFEVVQLQAQDVLLTTISEVIRQYVAIRSLALQIDLLQKKIDLQRKNTQLSHSLEVSGLSSQREMELSFSILEQDLAMLPTLQTSYKQTIYALAVLLGKQPEGLIALFEEKRNIPTSLGKVPAGLPSDLLRRRPDIRMAERKLAASTERIGAAIAEYFPKITLTGNSYGYESNQKHNWLSYNSNYWTIGPNLQWNLLDFGRTRAQVAVANSQQKQALFSYEQAVIHSLQDVEGALVAYFDEQKRSLHLLEDKESSLRFYQLTKDLFQAGLVNEIELLKAEISLLDKENSYIQSQQALATDLVSLYKALGGNWECSPTL